MKKLLFSFLLLTNLPVFADGGQIDPLDLKDLLRRCQDQHNELKCLKNGVRRLVNSTGGGGISEGNLVCKSNSNGKFAVYDDVKNEFLDSHYNKTAQECGRVIRAASRGMFCSESGSTNKFAIKRLSDGKYLSSYYNISLDDCIKSARYATHKYICISGQNKKFARYNYIDSSFLDSHYSLSIEDCISLL